MVLHEEHEVVGYQPPKTVLRQVFRKRDDRERCDADVGVGVEDTSNRAAGSVLALLSSLTLMAQKKVLREAIWTQMRGDTDVKKAGENASSFSSQLWELANGQEGPG